eukprot:TRINITY_DN2520_c0_g1_i2.p1 TRINITY_DN2520_c0_g1~~TRINITY_DN2520_c0_g1_i2.p1  ORF type:complete len:815 (+),score=191.06 TRINITY_DN2520_c0_g1_i2:35-2479(+)
MGKAISKSKERKYQEEEAKALGNGGKDEEEDKERTDSPENRPSGIPDAKEQPDKDDDKDATQRFRAAMAAGPKKGEENIGGDVLFENIRRMPRKKNGNDIMFIISCLKSHFVFYNHSDAELENIVAKMFFCEIDKNDYLFKQGDPAMCFFIIERGSLEVLVNQKPKRELKSGDGFGELALLYMAPRSASIRALEHCTMWGIDRNTYRKAVEEIITKEYEDNRKYMDIVKFFDSMTIEQKDTIAGVLITQRYSKGQYIVSEGDPGSSFYIIKDGVVSVMKGNNEVRKLYKGDSFGEQALYYNTVRQMSVKALDDVKVLALGRDTVTSVLGDQIHVITFKNIQKWALEKNALLSKLTKSQIEKVVENMKIINYKGGDVVFQRGSPCTKLVMIVEGTLKKSRIGTVVATKGLVYGEEYLIENARSNPKSLDDDIILENDGVVSEITFEAFHDLIGGKIEEVIKRNEEKYLNIVMLHRDKLQKLREEVLEVQLEDLIFCGKLRDGQFGPIYLAKLGELPETFVLKTIDKSTVSDLNVDKFFINSKKVQEGLFHPFIVNFYRTFRDNVNIYFLLEYIRGMELFDVIREMGLLNTYEAQFYVASMILVLEHLHTNMIIHRDIKPENIMVDQDGYVKLLDLGTAKLMKGKTGKAFTIIGTPHYMAPEILTGKGYSFSTDLWSLGICLYEFMCGLVPFGEESEDPYEIYEEIVKKDIKFPSYLKDRKARKLIDQLLNRNPEQRLGGSYAALKAHAWFDNFDWEKLSDRDLKAPFTPPKEKLMNEDTIFNHFQQRKPLIDEITKEYANDMQKESAEVMWDKEF